MTRSEQLIAEQNPLQCEVEPVYLFERGRILYAWEGGEHEMDLARAKSRLPVLERAPAGYTRFPLAGNQLARLAESLRVAISEAEKAGIRGGCAP